MKAKSASSPRPMRTRPKSGRIISFTLDPNNPPKLTRRDLQPRTEAEVIQAARSDPDNPPLTEEQLRRFKRAVRRK